MAKEKGITGLTGLKPLDAEITIKGKTYILSKYSLYAKAHFLDKYGFDKYSAMLESKSNEVVYSEIAYFLIDENGKRDFPTLDDFRKAFTDYEDQAKMVLAVLKTIGFSRQSAMTEEEEKDIKKNKKK